MLALNNPDFVLALRDCTSPNKIRSRMKTDFKLKNFVYAFVLENIPCINEEIINIGMNTGDDNRAYRKAGHLLGWGNNRLTGPSGADMNMIISKVAEKYPFIDVHKNDVTLLLWNTNILESKCINECPTKEAEKELIKQFKETFGGLPIGNVQDPNDRNKMLGTTHEIFDTFFEWD